jgi:hypothetical protein
VNKNVKVRDLQPVKDVKGGGGVTGESKSSTGTPETKASPGQASV